MYQINEGVTALLTATFLNEAGNPAVPTGGKFQISDADSGTVIAPWEAFTPTTASQNMIILEQYNLILDSTKTSEVRVITVVVQYSGAKQSVAEYRYEVLNLMDMPPNLNVSGSQGEVIGGTATIIGTHI
jgi:hypothetical protein